MPCRNEVSITPITRSFTRIPFGKERQHRLSFISAMPWAVLFADFLGMVGGNFLYRVEAGHSSRWRGALCGSARIRSGLFPGACEAGDDCRTDVCFGDEQV